MEQPSWLAAAWAELGVTETQGNADNPRVLAYYGEAGHGEIGHDEVPWCAAFAGAMLKRGGVAGTGSLMARSYLGWGETVSEPRPGAIAVLERGSDPAAGHVGFYVGETAGQIILLGGNQSDAVSVAAFDAKRLIAYRWPSLPGKPAEVPGKDAAPPLEAPLSEAEPADVFQKALTNVLELEGGFSDDPYDPGGPTNQGITLADFARFKRVTVDASSRARLIAELKQIPVETVRIIYRSRYWEPAHCAAMPDAVAFFHFDAAVNHGVRGAACMLQRVLGTDADGEIGPRTLAALSNRETASLIADYAAMRRDRYRALPHFWRFGRGWLKRVDISEAKAAALAGQDTSNFEQRKGGSAMEQVDNTITPAKWWAQSKTIWGAMITAAATVVPVLGPLIGLDLSGEVIRQAGEQSFAAVQAIAGLFGTFLTIYGRLTASGPLVRRAMNLKV